MSSRTTMILVTLLFDGVAVLWAVREYWSVRPGRSGGEIRSEPASAGHPGHPEGEHELDDRGAEAGEG